MEYISKKSCSIWTVCPCFFTKTVIFKNYIRIKILFPYFFLYYFQGERDCHNPTRSANAHRLVS